MVRSELLTLFKPAMRWALAQNSLGTHQGVLEGTQTVLTQLKEQKGRPLWSKPSCYSLEILVRVRVKLAQWVPAGGSKGKGNSKNPKSKPKDGAKKPAAGRRKTKPQTLPSPRTYVSLN